MQICKAWDYFLISNLRKGTSALSTLALAVVASGRLIFLFFLSLVQTLGIFLVPLLKVSWLYMHEFISGLCSVSLDCLSQEELKHRSLLHTQQTLSGHTGRSRQSVDREKKDLVDMPSVRSMAGMFWNSGVKARLIASNQNIRILVSYLGDT